MKVKYCSASYFHKITNYLDNTWFPHFFRYKIQGLDKSLGLLNIFQRPFLCMLKKCFEFYTNKFRPEGIKNYNYWEILLLFLGLFPFSRISGNHDNIVYNLHLINLFWLKLSNVIVSYMKGLPQKNEKASW